MYVKPCPVCGRMPKIEEIVSRTGIRRRMIGCPNLCSVIPSPEPRCNIETFYYVYEGDGDDNTIFKLWNKAIGVYESNRGLRWGDRVYPDWRVEE